MIDIYNNNAVLSANTHPKPFSKGNKTHYKVHMQKDDILLIDTYNAQSMSLLTQIIGSIDVYSTNIPYRDVLINSTNSYAIDVNNDYIVPSATLQYHNYGVNTMLLSTLDISNITVIKLVCLIDTVVDICVGRDICINSGVSSGNNSNNSTSTDIYYERERSDFDSNIMQHIRFLERVKVDSSGVETVISQYLADGSTYTPTGVIQLVPRLLRSDEVYSDGKQEWHISRFEDGSVMAIDAHYGTIRRDTIGILNDIMMGNWYIRKLLGESIISFDDTMYQYLSSVPTGTNHVEMQIQGGDILWSYDNGVSMYAQNGTTIELESTDEIAKWGCIGTMGNMGNIVIHYYYVEPKGRNNA